MRGDNSLQEKKTKILIKKAKTYLERSQPGEALRVFRQVLDLDPEHEQVQLWIKKLEGRLRKRRSSHDAFPPPKIEPSASTRPKPSGKSRADGSSGELRLPKKPACIPAAASGRGSATPSQSGDEASELGAASKESPGDWGRMKPAAMHSSGPSPREACQASRSRRPPRRRMVRDEELDLEDPEIAALLSGAARGGFFMRHQAGFLGLAILLVTAILAIVFHFHSHSFRMKLKSDSPILVMEQGRYFFVGWDWPRDVPVGYDQKWQGRLDNPELLEELRRGKVFLSGAEVEAFMLDIYTTLAAKARKEEKIESLSEALYYYKQGHRIYEEIFRQSGIMPPQELEFRKKMSETMTRLAELQIEQREIQAARESYKQLLQYSPMDREAEMKLARLSLEPKQP